MQRNSCYTYFSIKGMFEPDIITDILQLKPDTTWRFTDLRRDGNPYGFSFWSYGKCDAYDIETENQIKKTISKLLPKVNLLNAIQQKYDVNYTLHIVPEVCADETAPTLSSDLEIIDFCYAVRATIDVDLYVLD